MKTPFALTLCKALFRTYVSAADSVPSEAEQGFLAFTRSEAKNAGDDEVLRARFARMLEHTHYAGQTETTVARGVKDPVKVAFHSVALDSVKPLPDTYFARVEASFPPPSMPSANGRRPQGLARLNAILSKRLFSHC